MWNLIEGMRKMKRRHQFIFILFLLSVSVPQNVPAQENTYTNLPEGAKLRIGEGTLGEIAYFPDGTRFAVATSIGTWIYDSITGKKLYQLYDPKSRVYGIKSVSISPNGETITTESLDETVLFWNASTGELLKHLGGDEKGHYRALFSPDGRIVATSSGTPSEISNKAINLWDVSTGKLLNTLAEDNSAFYFNNKCFSPDGKSIATWQSIVCSLWDVVTGQLVKAITAHESSVNTVHFSPDNQIIATGGKDYTVRLWNANTGQLLNTLDHQDINSLTNVQFSPDGKKIATGGISSGEVHLWEVATGNKLRSFVRHTDNGVYSICFSPNGIMLATGGADGKIRLWSTNTGLELVKLIGHKTIVETILFSPDGITLLSKCSDNTVRLWDAITGQLMKTLDSYIESVVSISYSPDGKTIASRNSDYKVRLWNASTGQLMYTLTGHTDEIFSVCFSPDGKTLASGGRDKSIRIWDARTGKHLKSLTGHDESINRLYFISDGKTVVSENWNGKMYLWDTSTGHKLKSLYGKLISPDGDLMIDVYHEEVDDPGGIGDSFLSLSDVDSGQLLRRISCGWNISIQCFSPDSNMFVTSNTHNSILELWDVNNGKIINTYSGHLGLSYRNGGIIRAVRFSNDGKTIASGCDDKTVRLWSTEEGKHIKTLSGHTAGVNSVAFNPDGKTLASGSSDGTILLWDVTNIETDN